MTCSFGCLKSKRNIRKSKKYTHDDSTLGTCELPHDRPQEELPSSSRDQEDELDSLYLFVREIGRGTSASVSMYLSRETGQAHAIKRFFHTHVRGRRPTGTPALRDEITHEITMNHKVASCPNIVSMTRVIQDPDRAQVYLVMEYLGGGPVVEWIPSQRRYVVPGQDHALDEHQARVYCRQICAALSALLDVQCCHRDIKPGNILTNATRSECKLADLGLVTNVSTSNIDPPPQHHTSRPEPTFRRRPRDHLDLQESGRFHDTKSKPMRKLTSTKGTYAFMSPEMLSEDLSYCGKAADMYALGVTLYAMVCGRLPFYAPQVLDLFHQIETQPLAFESVGSPEFRDLVGQLMDKNPETRSTLADVLDHPWLTPRGSSSSKKKKKKLLRPRLVIQPLNLKHIPLGRIHLGPGDLALNHSKEGHHHHHHHSNDSKKKKLDHLKLTTPRPPELTKTTALLFHDVASNYRPSSSMNKPTPSSTSMNNNKEPRVLFHNIERMVVHLHYMRCSINVRDVQPPFVQDDADEKDWRPFHQLPQVMQDRYRGQMQARLDTILTLGYDFQTQKKSPKNAQYPPFDVGHVVLSGELEMLSKVLAEREHDAWSLEVLANGWRFGPEWNDQMKTHPCLIPYSYLEERVRQGKTLAIVQTIKMVLYFGVHILRRTSSS